MFESAELGHRIDKDTYEQQVPPLRQALLNAQYDLLEKATFPAILLIGGVDGAGKGETVNLLNAWMDPRHIQTHAMGEPSDEESERPPMWRFWRALPPKGKIGIFFGSWYTDPIVRRAFGDIGDAELDQQLQDVVRFERMLADEGALILKFWLHLSKKQQGQRLRSLESNPRTAWRVTPTDWRNFKRYDEFRRVDERALRQTSTAEAPWIVVEGGDARYRSLTVGTTILHALRARLDDSQTTPSIVHAPPFAPALDRVSVLEALDQSHVLDRKTYEAELETYQGKLNLLTRHPRFKKRSMVVVFEGVDAAGKGGAIRRITAALDARQYDVVPVAAPTEEERAQPYLWRFWRHVPRRGQITIFDRSWYGRVLVERIEGFCSEADWMRAYAEINDFEDQLARNGTLVVKFWVAIDKDEQLRRFQEREAVAFKHFKITPEDWRNRDKWDQYETAAVDMIDRTSTEAAPWTLVAADDKHYARVKILKTLARRLEHALD